MITQHDVPANYAHCFAGKDFCPKANSCLRAIAAQLLIQSKEPPPRTVQTVYASYVEQLTDPASCPLYRPCEPVRYAKGMTHIFDELPLKQAPIARSKVVNYCFSCERYYYYSRNGSRLISLDEQQKIAHVFRKIAPDLTPKFDGYEYVIEW